MRPFIYVLLIGCAINALNMIWVMGDVVSAFEYIPGWDDFYYPETKRIAVNFYRALAETLASVVTAIFGVLLLKRSRS
ncbi:hypothetical protein [Pseudidiomarina homiensis]|uniref:hypothetical protein n=1 Tax=Pseudidiomarina homiensis TaxID=364198 RepID=UPI00215A551F|nr:hypothetical protein [Pseudidiomarina homiensis]